MPEQPALATESPFAIADAVALGMLSRIAISAGESKTRLRPGLVAAALATFVLSVSLPNIYAVYLGLVPLLMALVGCIFILHLADEVRVRRLQRSLLTSAALVLLGKMSLSLFLLHPLVNTVLTLAFAIMRGS
jgi:peptidoglycan/LPS O-acetylase OafA/YrhL